MKQPLVLMILDGFGLSNHACGNAILSAQTPNLDRIFARWPTTQLMASGLDVGLPEGQMGNSEVGHTNMGAGRVVYQDLTRITGAVQDGSFFSNPVLTAAMRRCKQTGAALHLAGLLSDGGVHSHNSHLYALLELARRHELDKVFIHCFTDGRDVPPHSGGGYVTELVQKLEEIGVGQIATIMGRYYAMDRDNRWERVKKAWAAMLHGEGARCERPENVPELSYASGVTDEFILPTVCAQNACIRPGDSVICFNFRPDRARELTRALVDPDFTAFDRPSFPEIHYVCMTQYDALMPNVQLAFAPQDLHATFGECLSSHGLRQLRIAETEKYPHVTFFFSGGAEAPWPGEDRVLVPSPKVATYDLKPAMSAFEVTDRLLALLDTGDYSAVILNYANCDMVGHTGVFSAAVQAVQAVDTCVGRVADKVLSLGGVLLLTADHGNAEQMYEPDCSPFTAHTTNPVPFAMVGREGARLLPPKAGRLCDIAPTMLQILGLPQPNEMSGRSILL